MDWELGVGRCKLFTLIFRVNKNSLPLQHRNYLPAPGINHNGKALIKENVYICKNWVISLYSRDWHSMVHQLHFNLNQKRRWVSASDNRNFKSHSNSADTRLRFIVDWGQGTQRTFKLIAALFLLLSGYMNKDDFVSFVFQQNEHFI